MIYDIGVDNTDTDLVVQRYDIKAASREEAVKLAQDLFRNALKDDPNWVVIFEEREEQ